MILKYMSYIKQYNNMNQSGECEVNSTIKCYPTNKKQSLKNFHTYELMQP